MHLAASTLAKNGVGDGARTRDNRNHNPGLYQLSYTHQDVWNCKIMNIFGGKGKGGADLLL